MFPPDNPLEQTISYHEFPTELAQYVWIARQIQKLLTQGCPPGEIAVINRKHKELTTLAEILQAQNIPIFYEKGQDVLQKPIINQLLTILKFIHSLNQKEALEADALLPTILSFPFWELEPTDIWKLSVFAYQQPTIEARLWLTCLLQADKVEVNGQKLTHPEKFEQIGQFLLNLASQAKWLPVEQLIDQIVDSHWPNWSEDDEDQPVTTPTKSQFHTNFAQYYFHQYLSDTTLTKSIPVSAIDFLSNLQTLFQAIRQHKVKEVLYLQDFLEFIQLAEKNQIAIIDRSAYGNSHTGVNLLTAHKAKGLEFSVVFIPNCNQDYWFGRGRVDKLNLPDNIILSKDVENEDDYIRLLFVAITRAKDQLYLTRYTMADNGKATEPIVYLQTSLQALNILPAAPSGLDSNLDRNSGASTDLQATALLTWQQVTNQTITLSTQSWLSALLDNYKLSVTHLNDFLDLEKGGPLNFVQKHLLKFPQSPSPQAAYGTAMHSAVSFLLSKPTKITLEELLNFFAQRLLEQRLNPNDYEQYVQLGKTNLTIFYQNYNYYNFTNPKLEYDFSHQVVQIGQAKLTGKIDCLVFENNQVTIVDFKTGQPVFSWTGRNSQEQTKLWRYRNQLMFYKLLVENSPSFHSSFQVTTGQLQFLDAHYLTDPKPQDLVLETSFDTTEMVWLAKLIQVVYQKIVTLDFPDTSQYPPTFQGTQEFCQDLLR